MDYNEVKELISIIDNSTLTEFELSIDNVSVRISKTAGGFFGAFSGGKNEQATVFGASAAANAGRELSADVPMTIFPDKKEEINGHVIKSPIVGTFYEGASPDAPAFVKVGDSVKKGETLCIIEAMKIMNEITSDVDGQIAEILATHENMVEFNQPLFRIC